MSSILKIVGIVPVLFLLTIMNANASFVAIPTFVSTFPSTSPQSSATTNKKAKNSDSSLHLHFDTVKNDDKKYEVGLEYDKPLD